MDVGCAPAAVLSQQLPDRSARPQRSHRPGPGRIARGGALSGSNGASTVFASTPSTFRSTPNCATIRRYGAAASVRGHSTSSVTSTINLTPTSPSSCRASVHWRMSMARFWWLRSGRASQRGDEAVYSGPRSPAQRIRVSVPLRRSALARPRAGRIRELDRRFRRGLARVGVLQPRRSARRLALDEQR